MCYTPQVRVFRLSDGDQSSFKNKRKKKEVEIFMNVYFKVIFFYPSHNQSHRGKKKERE